MLLTRQTNSSAGKVWQYDFIWKDFRNGSANGLFVCFLLVLLGGGGGGGAA